jgi:hypothetical protein
LTTRGYFDAGSPVGRYRQGSRSKAVANSHPATERSYRYRSYMVCDICSRRMFGKTRRRKTRDDDTYYACVIQREHHRTESWYDVHPAALTVNQDVIDPFVARFFNERVFGPHRLSFLDGPVDQPVRSEIAAAAAGYARQLDELDAANTNLIVSLQQMTSTGDAEIDAQWRAQLQAQFAANTKRRQAIAAELATLANTVRQPAAQRRDIVDQLPVVKLNVLDLPEEEQRQLFDAFQLQIRYDRHRHRVTLRVAIRADMIDSIGDTAVELAGPGNIVPRQRRSTQTDNGADTDASAPQIRSHVRRAPGGSPGERRGGQHAGEGGNDQGGRGERPPVAPPHAGRSRRGRRGRRARVYGRGRHRAP